MKKKRKSGTAYLMQLAGKYKLHLFVSALFGIASALCSFVPYVMVYRSIWVLLDGEGNALRYGLIAAAAIAGKFLCSIVSGTFSHIGAFNTLYNVRTQISRHIAKVNLGFFTDHASGEIKKVIIEDVERIERFLAHQIPDVTSAIPSNTSDSSSRNHPAGGEREAGDVPETLQKKLLPGLSRLHLR